ncbi:hypothetical protein Efla_005733 [Eimeria flavescens]
MPREVITVQVGQCGNQVGGRLWELLLAEHAQELDASASDPPFNTLKGGGPIDDGMSAVFSCTESRFVSSTLMCRKISQAIHRHPEAFGALLVDMEEGVVQRLLRSSLGSLFDDTLLITDVSGAGNNWAYGHEVYGYLHGHAIVDTVEKALEKCESPQDLDLERNALSVSLLSSKRRSAHMTRGDYMHNPGRTDDVVTSPYNTALAVHELEQHATCVLPVCNDALTRAANNSEESSPFAHANGLIAHVLAHLTREANPVKLEVRFSGPLDVDLLDISSNLVPYKGLHFLSPALSPFVPDYSHELERVPQFQRRLRMNTHGCFDGPSPSKLLQDVLGQNTQLLDVRPKNSALYLSGTLPYGRHHTENRNVRFFPSSSSSPLSSAQLHLAKVKLGIALCLVSG